jgi:hypothetical protein
MKPSREAIRRALILLWLLVTLYLLLKYPAHDLPSFPPRPFPSPTTR